ncbi:MAG: hypothetical protein J6J86_05030, partial [Lachnospiraceae bacterium]|nr:hypothetical protein [Lachnospiraceae bacterium]
DLMTLQDAKWMLDLLASMGINFYNVHAFYYTIDSITKHDAPPSQFLQNPYWKNYHILADYAGRLSAWVSNTESENNVAVLDPIVSYWTHMANSFHRAGYAGTDEEEKAALETLKADWMHIVKELRYAHIGADLLDTEILAMAEIADGRIRIGKAEYTTLVLTPNTAIEYAATKKIKEFLAHGGQVIAIGLLPYEVIDEDTEVENTYREIMQHGNAFFVPVDGSVKEAGNEAIWLSLIAKAAKLPVTVCVSEKDRKSIYSSIRRGKDGELYIMLGNYEGNYVNLELQLEEDQTSAWCMNFEDADVTAIKMCDGKVQVALAPFETKLIRFDKQPAGVESVTGAGCAVNSAECAADAACVHGSVSCSADRPCIVLDMEKPLDVSIQGDNVYRLENFMVSVDGEDWKETEVKTLIEMCDATGILKGDNFVYQSEFGTPKAIRIKYPLQLYYKTKVQIETVPSKAGILLDARCITGDYEISINGHVLHNADFEAVFVNDQNNRMQDITAYLCEGENEIAVSVLAKNDWDGIRDPIYIMGDFGVQGGTLTKKPEKAVLRKRYIEGFPYYSGDFSFKGSFTLSEAQTGTATTGVSCGAESMSEQNAATQVGTEARTVADIRLSCSDEIHDCMELIVNGVSLGVRAFAPNTWRVKAGILQKENTFELRYTNTLIHMLEGSYFDYDVHDTIRIEE